MVYVFLADGFEECEALTPVDILRRGSVEVKTVGVTGKEVTGSHGIKVVCDICPDSVVTDKNLEAVILPGGMPGTVNLEKDETVQKTVDYAVQNGKLVAAICAAPSILGHKNLLNGKNAVCFPGFEKDLYGANIVKADTVVDGNIITAVGAGAAFAFGYKILEYLTDEKTADNMRKNMQYNV